MDSSIGLQDREDEFKGEENGCAVDCEYEYVFVGPSAHYGLLSHHADQCDHSFSKKGIKGHTEIKLCDQLHDRTRLPAFPPTVL